MEDHADQLESGSDRNQDQMDAISLGDDGVNPVQTVWGLFSVGIGLVRFNRQKEGDLVSDLSGTTVWARLVITGTPEATASVSQVHIITQHSRVAARKNRSRAVYV